MLPRRSVTPFLLLAVGGGLLVAAGSQPPTLAPPYQGPLEIHLLPHSHQDAGFIVTYSHVRDQLCDRTYETIFECLRDDATRTFNVAEINFFSHWYDSKNASVQAEVRRMVHETKQYGFCEGGWVQPDEGATNYLGRINQATLGQEWLKARLDVSPTAGWHMDPFGNSAISPLLFDGYGFDAHVVSGGRLPTYRLGNVAWGEPYGQTRWHWQQQLQNVWQGAGGAAVMQHIIEEMYMELSGDPDWPGHGYLWESGLPAIVEAAPWASEAEAAAARSELHSHHQRKFNEPPPLETSPPVNASNLARLSEDLVRRARNNTQFFQPSENATVRPTLCRGMPRCVCALHTSRSCHIHADCSSSSRRVGFNLCRCLGQRPRAIMIPWGGDWTFSGKEAIFIPFWH
jgi:hypothetical protein